MDIVNLTGARIAPGIMMGAIICLLLLTILVRPWIRHWPRAEAVLIDRVMMPLGIVVLASGLFFVVWIFGALIVGTLWALGRAVF